MKRAKENVERERPSKFGTLISSIFVVLFLLFGWFGVRTQLGSMLAELTSPAREDANDVAALAISLAPNDPRPRKLSALALRRTFAPEDVEGSIRRLQESTIRGPNDFRNWMDLARGYEQAEMNAEAEVALLRAVELAPSYASTHWQLANFLIRQGRDEEAKNELKRVTESYSPLRAQVFALAWDNFGKSVSEVENINSHVPGAQVELAYFLVQRASGKDALRIWTQIPETEKLRYAHYARPMSQMLLQQGFALEAQTIAREGGIIGDSMPETLVNGSFEQPVGEPEDELFGWRIYRYGEKFEALQVASDAYEGTRSIKTTFRNYSKPGYFNIAQIVVVEPEQRYRLRFSVKIEGLRSAGLPLVDVAAIKGYQTIARSAPFPLGTHGWQQITIEFQVPNGVNGIDIRTVRDECPEPCGITGTIWLDDFQLMRI